MTSSVSAISTVVYQIDAFGIKSFLNDKGRLRKACGDQPLQLVYSFLHTRGETDMGFRISLGNTSSLPNGGDEQASASERPRSLSGGDKFRSVVGFVAKTLVVRKDAPKLRLVTLTLVDQYANELRLDKLVVPLPGRADTLAEKRRDRCLEASIVAAVGATVVAAIDGFGFCGE